LGVCFEKKKPSTPSLQGNPTRRSTRRFVCDTAY
jgi:hypothetical protein